MWEWVELEGGKRGWKALVVVIDDVDTVKPDAVWVMVHVEVLDVALVEPSESDDEEEEDVREGGRTTCCVPRGEACGLGRRDGAAGRCEWVCGWGCEGGQTSYPDGMVGEVGMLNACSEYSSGASAGSRAARYLVSMLIEGKGWGSEAGCQD